ncbi:hypothetical protein GCM10023088_52070 [Actinomadura verrucosospora]
MVPVPPADIAPIARDDGAGGVHGSGDGLAGFGEAADARSSTVTGGSEPSRTSRHARMTAKPEPVKAMPY